VRTTSRRRAVFALAAAPALAPLAACAVGGAAGQAGPAGSLPSPTEAPARAAVPPTPVAPTPAPPTVVPTAVPTAAPTATPVSPLAVPALRARSYEGGEIRVLQTLSQNAAYVSQLFEYPSDGLRVRGVMKVPRGAGPFPVLLLNHGYYAVSAYRSGNGTDNAGDFLARAGYLTLASDYRGFGGSDNDASGQNAGHRVEYAVDVLNLLASVQRLPQADSARVGMWGHSMGGEVGLRTLEADRDRRISGTVFWAPTSGDVRANNRFYAGAAAPELAQQIAFQLSPINYVGWVDSPVALHQGDRDREVDPQWTVQLRDALQAAGKEVEFFWYPGQDHNWSGGWGEIAPRTVAFFDRHVKARG
jgi:uncharacterized protein